jgi:hypothetical protein
LLFAQPETLPSPGTSLSDSVTADTTFQDTLNKGVSIVTFRADTVIFYAENKEVLLLHDAWIKYGNIKVYSDSIRFSTQKRRLSAYKNVKFMSTNDSVVGSHMVYDVESKKGVMEEGKTQIEKGFCYGHGIWLVRENTLHVTNGYYTTCDHNPPHYDFYGQELKVILDDMVIARPVFLRVFKVPVLAAPFWYLPIGKDRKSGFLPFQLSYNATEGWFIKQARYYWVISDYMDALFSADVMTRTGIKPGVLVNWLWGPHGAEYLSGSMSGDYINEIRTKRRRWKINLSDRTSIPDGTAITADINLTSDGNYKYQYSDNPDSTPVILDQTTQSNISVSRSIFGRPVSLTASRTDDLKNSTYSMTLPSFNLSWPTLNLLDFFTLSFSSFSINNQYNRTIDTVLGDSTKIFADSRTTTFSQPLSLSWAYTFFGAYTFSQSWGAGQSLTLTQDSIIRGGSYSLTNSFGTTFYRLFAFPIPRTKGLLHTVTPSVSYSITPATGQIYPWLVYPRFDTTLSSHTVSLSVGQSFQTKIRSRSDTTVFNKQTLLNLGTGIGYNLRTGSLYPLTASLSLPSGLPLYVSATMSYNLYSGTTALGANTYVQFDEIIFSLLGLKKGSTHDTSSKDSTFSISPTVDTSMQDTTVTDTAALDSLRTKPKKDEETYIDRLVKSRLSVGYIWGTSLSTSGVESRRHMLDFRTDVYLPLDLEVVLGASANFSEPKADWRNYILAPSLSVIKGLHCWEAVVEVKPKSGVIFLDPDSLEWNFYLRIKELPDIEIGTKLFERLTGG